MIRIYDEKNPISSEGLEAIAKLDRAFSEFSWTDGFFKSLSGAHSDYLYLTASKDDKLLGVAVIRFYESKNAELLKILVLPTVRGESYGDRLISSTIAYLSSFGYELFFLDVATENLTAMGLYEKHGLSVIGRKKGFYRNGSDAFQMTLNLKTL